MRSRVCSDRRTVNSCRAVLSRSRCGGAPCAWVQPVMCATLWQRKLFHDGKRGKHGACETRHEQTMLVAAAHPWLGEELRVPKGQVKIGLPARRCLQNSSCKNDLYPCVRDKASTGMAFRCTPFLSHCLRMGSHARASGGPCRAGRRCRRAERGRAQPVRSPCRRSPRTLAGTHAPGAGASACA